MIICLSLLLLLQGCAPVQAQGSLESRVSRLESEIFGLRSQVNQLQSQLTGRGRGNSPSIPPATSGSVSSKPFNDPMFDRLATLVIELKERLNAVESRLAKLEGKRP
jgi:hypothetical protein